MTGVEGADDTPRERSARDFGWAGDQRLPYLWQLLLDDGAHVSFGHVVQAHYLSVAHEDDDVQQEARAIEQPLRSKFEAQHGAIRGSYFMQHALGGVAITERRAWAVADRPQGFVSRFLKRPEHSYKGAGRELHDVLNSQVPDLVMLAAECRLLFDHACEAFSSPRLQPQARALTDAIYSAITRVLSAADLCAKGGATQESLATSLNTATREVDHVRIRVQTSIQRQARFVYFRGALFGALGTIFLAGLLGYGASAYWPETLITTSVVAATVFGALGGVVSVFQRISTGALILDFNASQGQLTTLGALRPFVGALFGMVVQFALLSGLLGAGATSSNREAATFGLFALIGFVSGFSERFATDMVERAGQVLAGAAPRSEQKGTSTPARANAAPGDMSPAGGDRRGPPLAPAAEDTIGTP